MAILYWGKNSSYRLILTTSSSFVIYCRGRRLKSKDEPSDRFTIINDCGDSPKGLEMLPQGWNLQQFGQQFNDQGIFKSTKSQLTFFIVDALAYKVAEQC